ncbi:MAG: acyl-CoA dehydrogenase family protein, partial [Clostridia bacterium]|nr:acyl-CoA dehydrogenase family protein [Clostridia bacterium]
MDFRLSEEEKALKAAVRQLAEREFRDKAAYWDEKEEFPAPNRDRLAELGYLGLLIPQEYGGQGAPFFHGILT